MKMRKTFFCFLAAAFALVSCETQQPVQPSEPEIVKVTSVSLDASTLDLYVDSTAVLVASVQPGNATDKSVKWVSDNESVVSVDASGKLTGKAEGSAKVSVTTTDGGFTAACQVSVSALNIPVKSIKAVPDTIIVRIGKTQKVNVEFIPANATDRTLTYDIPTRFQKFATIDSEGVLTGVGEGQFILTIKSGNGKVAKAVVKSTYENLPWEGGYPVGVKVTKFTDDLGGGLTCEGAWAEIDLSANVALRFNTLHGSNKTIIGVDENDKVDWYDQFPKNSGIPVILINAGFFDAKWGTSSAVITEGSFQAAGATSTGIKYDGYKGTYYPVRSAICQKKDGSISIEWIYIINSVVYTYPSALGQNDQTGVFFPTSQCPTSKPTASTPGAGKWEDGWNLMQGGPRLVQNGVNVAWSNTWAELLDGTVTNASKGESYRTARTACGITSEGHLIMLVCYGDGRNDKNPAGFNMSELADKMIEVGCVDAVNFDGGGSSQMIGPDGKSIVPQIGSSMRAIPTVMAISEKQYD